MTEVVRVVEGSRRQALRVTWEHGRLTHVVETQVQHADSLQAWGAAQFSHSKKSSFLPLKTYKTPAAMLSYSVF